MPIFVQIALLLLESMPTTQTNSKGSIVTVVSIKNTRNDAEKWASLPVEEALSIDLQIDKIQE